MILTAATAVVSAEPEVSIVSDLEGQKLLLDGEDTMVFGMNWGYVPIGENYLYNLWAQPEDFIKTVLDREMPLLQDMGVNSIRLYVGIPPRWVQYIYEEYGITTMLNHTVGRYGYTIDGAWVPSVDYSDPRFRKLVTEEIIEWVELYRDTPGVIFWLLGNENNYGLHWSSFEIEALPEGQRDEARARYLYSLFEDITREINRADPEKLVAIANGDLQYIDIIAEECTSLDILGTNVYRGISARDLYAVVEEKLGIPIVYTEFGADAYNAREMREDQLMQAKYLIGQWQEIYEQSYGKGRVGNAIGGYIFQWSDGWWKYLQESRLDIHDTHASWPNGGYIEDYVEGEYNMNEEWWGITAKGPPDHRGLYQVYPRAAYYALRRAFKLDPYAPTTDLQAIREHFAPIRPATAALQARSDRAALLGEPRERVHVSDVRLEFETFNTGGEHTTTPEDNDGSAEGYPSFQGFDHLESFYIDVEVKPTESVSGKVSVNILGNVPENPIDEIFYENRGRKRTVGETEIGDVERVKVYQASVSWDDKWFMLDGFYRTGHLHWKHEGDFFGLYRDAYYGENVDIYNGMAPVGFELAGKKHFDGLKVAFGPQLWWGANPAVLLKYRKQIGPLNATAVYHEDIDEQSSVSTSIAIPEPKTRKVSLQFETGYGDWNLQGGALWSGSTKVGDEFQIVEDDVVYEDEIIDGDTFGGKAKVTWQKGRWHWYAQAARMGLVANAGPDPIITFTGWQLKDSGLGNQTNFLTGLAVNVGNLQIAPNFLWQEPIIGPIPDDVPDPGRPRNVLSDPFAVRGNREQVGGELLFTYDPTPATWFWQWDNNVREDAPLAASIGFVYRHLPTTMDVTNFIAEDGVTVYSFGASPPPEDLWSINARLVSKLAARTRMVATLVYERTQPRGWDPSDENETLNRTIETFSADGTVTHGPWAVGANVAVNGWGPYDYHRDFNLTYPLQVGGDISYSLGQPRWFGDAQTRIGVSGKWRSLDLNSNRYDAESAGDEEGSEWEIRTYVHVAL
ncbi:MAG: glycosidase [Candidatus Eisenbacteria bacterium]|nr:glycosidase [Candidatus Eisenbacteria bacterium]